MTPYRIAVVGSGPRGMMVVERLAARLAADATTRPVELHVIDATEVGAGRIYRTDQPDWFLMNTVAGQISAFSGVPDGGPARAGAGPSLVEWWSTVDPDRADLDGYAPRALYGRYLRFVLDAVEAGLPEPARLVRARAEVTDLTADGDRYRLRRSDGATLLADRVVLTTGHSVPELTGLEHDLAAFAERRPHLRYVRGDSAAEMPLAEIRPGTAVGVLGLGLSFYDVMAALTTGRGGTFAEAGDGGLRYRPSGAEPVLVAGSRSGMPLPARGRNQKPPTYSYRPVLFTPEHVRRARPGGRLDFAADVLPWLLAEVDLVYYGTVLSRWFGPDVAERFAATVARRLDAGAGAVRVPDVVAVARDFGAGRVPRLDLDELARPFGDVEFLDPAAFDRALVAAVHRDLAHAADGNVDSPLKAALDVLRDTRWVIRTLVDFGGLDPVSHRVDFLGWYVPRSAFLAAGPPAVRLRQVLALLDCGLLRIVGPAACFAGDPETDRFVVSSPRVRGSAVPADVLIDARIPNPDLARDLGPLTRRLRDRGTWTSYRNEAGDQSFDTGGVAVTGSPFHPLDRAGNPDRRLYVLGIPTEHTRWFMQVGSSRPGMWSDFVHDADNIAADALAPVTAGAPVRAPVAAVADP